MLLHALTAPLSAQSAQPLWKLQFYGQAPCTNADGSPGTQVIQFSGNHLVTDNPLPQSTYPDSQFFMDAVSDGMAFAVFNNDGAAVYSINGCGVSLNSPPQSVQDNNFTFLPDADGSGNGVYYATSQVGDGFCGQPQIPVKFDSNAITLQGYISDPTGKVQCAVSLAGPNSTLPPLPIGPGENQPTQPLTPSCTNTVNCPLEITSSSFLPDARDGFYYNTLIMAVGGTAPYHWELLPADDPFPLDKPKNIDISNDNGPVASISGPVDGNYPEHFIFPASSGWTFKIRVTDHHGNNADQLASISVMPPLGVGPPWTPEILPQAMEGVHYFGYLQGIGGDDLKYTKRWSVTSGKLPKGISVSPTGSDCIFSGVPAAGSSGTYPFRLHLSDGFSAPADIDVVLNVFSSGSHSLQISTKALPDATNGQKVDNFLAASGGSGGYIWTVHSGSIPGMALHASGELTGTAESPNPAPYQLAVQVADSKGDRATGIITMLVKPKPGGTLEYFGTGTLPRGNPGQAFVQQIPAVGGKPPYRFQVAAGSLPAGLSLTPDGLITGTPSGSYNATVTFSITDGSGTTVHAPIHITISTVKIPAITGVQPETLTENSGAAQITVTTNASTPGLTLEWNGQALSGVAQGDTIKATVPAGLTSLPGQTHLTLVASDGTAGNDFVYPVLSTQPAYLISPGQGMVLSGTVNFQWQQAKASEYAISIGTTGAGSKDIAEKNISQPGGSYAAAIPSKGETVYVRLSSQMADGWHYNDYKFQAAAAPPPPPPNETTAKLTLLFRNALLYTVNVSANGTSLGTIPASNSATFVTTITPPLVVSFQVNQPTLDGRVLGDPMSGQFESIAAPSGNIEFDITNLIGSQLYFIPVITNTRSTGALMGVNMGLQAENRCQCIIPPNVKNDSAGYYLLYTNSNVELFAPGSNYTGEYTYWGLGGGTADTSLAPLVQAKSGVLLLSY